MHMLMLFSEITSFEYVFLLLVLAYIELINIDTKNLKKKSIYKFGENKYCYTFRRGERNYKLQNLIISD